MDPVSNSIAPSKSPSITCKACVAGAQWNPMFSSIARASEDTLARTSSSLANAGIVGVAGAGPSGSSSSSSSSVYMTLTSGASGSTDGKDAGAAPKVNDVSVTRWPKHDSHTAGRTSMPSKLGSAKHTP